MNTENSSVVLRYRKLVARLKDIVQCVVCLEIVGCPAVQCEAGHLMCGRCRDNLRGNTCPTCRQPLIAVRNLAVEQVVEVLPVECPNVDHGCQELLDAEEVETHRVTCTFRQFSCPHSPCPWFGYKPEVIVHMRAEHPQHIPSTNKQTVKVPAKWDEVSSWIMFLNDEILVLKFCLDRATNFLLGSFECLGLLNPTDSIVYLMTVKRGDCKTTLSGCIAPERSDTDSQCNEEWDSVFPRSKFDEIESSSTSRYINVDVAVEDNRIAVAQASVDVEEPTLATVDVEVQTQASVDVEEPTLATVDVEVQTPASIDVDVQHQASVDVEVQTQATVDIDVQTQASLDVECDWDTTREDGGRNQSDQTTYHVIHKLGCWINSGFYNLNKCSSSVGRIHQIMITTNDHIISSLVKSIDDINKLFRSDFYVNYLGIEMNLYLLSRDFAETKIKMERVRAAGGRQFKMEWILPYFLIVEQAVYQAFSNYVDKFPTIDDVELEKLLTVRKRRMRDESAQRTLTGAHVSRGTHGVTNMIRRMGHVYKKSEEEISSLVSEADTIPWSDITPIS